MLRVNILPIPYKYFLYFEKLNKRVLFIKDLT